MALSSIARGCNWHVLLPIVNALIRVTLGVTHNIDLEYSATSCSLLRTVIVGMFRVSESKNVRTVDVEDLRQLSLLINGH